MERRRFFVGTRAEESPPLYIATACCRRGPLLESGAAAVHLLDGNVFQTSGSSPTFDGNALKPASVSMLLRRACNKCHRIEFREVRAVEGWSSRSLRGEWEEALLGKPFLCRCPCACGCRQLDARTGRTELWGGGASRGKFQEAKNA